MRNTNMKNIFEWLTNPPITGPTSTLLLRVMAGGVFLWEGVLKFVYVNQGVGRFTKLGMPFPHFTAGFVGGLVIAWRLSGAALGVSGRARTSRRLWKALQNASSTSLTEIPGGKKQNIYNLPPQPGKRQRRSRAD